MKIATIRELPKLVCAAALVALVYGCKTAPPSTSQPATTQPSATPTAPVPKPATGTPITPEAGKQVLRENAAKERAVWQGKTFEEFKAQVYLEPFADGKYIVNGDTPVLSEKQLREFFVEQVQKEPMPGSAPVTLAVNTEDGQDTIWNSTQRRQLTYCVSDKFDTRYATVVADMAAAGGAWSRSADVQFVHVASLDGACDASTQGVVFDVRPVNVNGQYLARAFFPNEPRASRNVLIDESAFQLAPGGKLTLVGILRHELGHTLGFRHEHTRPDSGTCFEDSNWRPLTAYDRFSVMHYPQCNGGGDWSLVPTMLDQQGSACIYGPAPGFNVDPNICPDFEPVEGGAPCASQTQTFANQQVAKGSEMPYGPFAVAPGTRLEVKMLGNGPTGDPDLYVSFGQRPTTAKYACRPYLEGANEACSLDVPAGRTQAFVVVRGYSAAPYHLVVTHTGGGQ